MARINIEDSLYKEKSFEKLTLKLGSKRMALGALVEAYTLAQEYYLNLETDRLIPLIVWNREEIENNLIECGFAEIVNNDFVKVRGIENQFSWLLQKQEAGKKGGRPKKESSENNQIDEANETDRLTSESGVNPLTLTLSLTPSLTQDKEININSNINSLVPTSKKIEVVTIKKNQKDLIKITEPKQLADLLDTRNKNLLFDLYGDAEYIKREFYKIQNWLDANPRKNNKTKRGWLAFVAGWLERGWPKYQQSIPSNSTKASSVDELMSMMGWS